MAMFASVIAPVTEHVKAIEGDHPFGAAEEEGALQVDEDERGDDDGNAERHQGSSTSPLLGTGCTPG
jgi:hypothetical protein